MGSEECVNDNMLTAHKEIIKGNFNTAGLINEMGDNLPQHKSQEEKMNRNRQINQGGTCN